MILAGCIVLLLPALLSGRPFIYWDTPTFYGWGHDILAAIRRPWPPLADFPPHRGLWAADNFPGAWEHVTAHQFQLVMTAIGARSSFYAVPLYAIGSTLTLWAPAALQSLLAAWLLWVTADAAFGRARPLAYARLIAALTAFSTLPYFAAYLMPDIFAAYALLAAGLLLCFHDRLTPRRRAGLAAVLAYAVVVHLSVLPAVVATLLAGLVVMRVMAPRPRARPGALAAAAALACAGVAAYAGGVGMKAIFGQEVRSPPFLEGRVIADGPGQRFLRETCAERGWAACRWKDSQVLFTDDIIWPDVTWHGLPLITEPAERQRFLNEQPAIVLGTILHHPLAQFWASARNAMRQLATFTTAYDVGGALHGLLTAHSDRTMRVAQIVPNIGPCLKDPHACDQTHAFKLMQAVQYVVVAASLLVVGGGLMGWLSPAKPAEGDRPQDRRLAAFAILIIAGVALNGIVCGVLSRPWGRYQARVIWLIPMAAELALETALQRAKPTGVASQWRHRPDEDAGEPA